MVIYQQGLKIDLYRFLILITNINDLVEFAKKDVVLDDGSVVNWRRYFEEIRDMRPENSPRTRIITKLDPFIYSSYGYLFNVIAKDNVISLRQSIRNGEIVLFLLDASAFSLDTQRVAKMVISDINATFAELGKLKTPIKTFCCFDEFKNYETDAISKTISLHRSNGMHAIIGTQSLALIDKEIGNGILANCQTHLVMASADEDAMRFSEEFGKMDKMDTTTRIREDRVSELITKTIRAYKIDKQDIKDIVDTDKIYEVYYDIVRKCFTEDDYKASLCPKTQPPLKQPHIQPQTQPQPQLAIWEIALSLLKLDLKDANDVNINEFFKHFVKKIYEDYYDLDQNEDAEYNYVQHEILSIIFLNVGSMVAYELVNRLMIYCNKHHISNAPNALAGKEEGDTRHKVYTYAKDAITDEIIEKLGVKNPDKQYTTTDTHDDIIIDALKTAYSFVAGETDIRDIKQIITFYRTLAENIAKNSYDEMRMILDDLRRKSLLIEIAFILQ
jgi:hypothetical protein